MTAITPPPDEVSSRTISTIWTVVATTLFYITLNTWSHTQGATFEVPYNVFSKLDRYGALLFAIPVNSVFLIVTLWLAEVHAQQSRARSWKARFPRAFRAELDLDVKSSVGMWYQRFFLLFYVVFPLCGLGHFTRLFLTRRPTNWSGTEVVSLFRADWSAAFDSLAYKFHGLSYFPAWQPWLYFSLLSVVLYRLLRFVRATFLFSRRRQPRPVPQASEN